MNTEHDERNISWQELSSAINEINRVIANCPKETLLDIFERHRGVALAPETLALQMDGHLSHLESMVELGCDDATEVLMNMGLRIARFLNDKSKQFDAVDTAEASQPAAPSQENVEGDRITPEGLYDQLKPKLAILMNTGECEIEEAWKAISKKYKRDDYMLKLAVGMLRSFHVPNEGRINIDHESQDQNTIDDGARLQNHTTSKIITIDYILHRLLVHKCHELKCRTIRTTARNSFAWTAVISADASQRKQDLDRQISELDLGGGLGLSMTKIKRGPQSSRKNNPSTDIRKIYEILEFERQRKIHLHTSQRTLLEAQEKKYIRAELISENGESISWTPDNFWKLKASLLPAPGKKQINQWVDATMAWFESRVASAIRVEIGAAWDQEIIPLSDKRNRLKLNYPCKESLESHGLLVKCTCENCQKTLEDLTETSNQLSALRNLQIKQLRKKVSDQFMNYAWPEKGEITTKAKLKEVIKNGYKSLFE